MPQLQIRAYEPRDRDPVRRICFETGYMGDPIAWQWRDGESFADVATRYYTDREPESTLVAERDGRVVGYLTGCANSERTRGFAEQEVRRLLRRGALLRPGVAGVFWRSLYDLLRDRQAPDEFLADPRWPAHLHINLLPEGRRSGLGRSLVTRWVDRLRDTDSPGVHLGTFAENTNAIPFFAACGFRRHGEPVRVPGLRTREGRRMHVQWMVQSL